MSDTATVRRPGGVTLVALLIFLAAVVNVIAGIWLILSPIGENPTITSTLDGSTTSVPTFWLIINGVLSLVLGLIYLWLGRMTLAGSATAHLLIQVLAVINIVFALFRLTNWSGWIALAVNALILLLVNTPGAKAWFTRIA